MTSGYSYRSSWIYLIASCRDIRFWSWGGNVEEASPLPGCCLIQWPCIVFPWKQFFTKGVGKEGHHEQEHHVASRNSDFPFFHFVGLCRVCWLCWLWLSTRTLLLLWGALPPRLPPLTASIILCCDSHSRWFSDAAKGAVRRPCGEKKTDGSYAQRENGLRSVPEI